MVVGDHEDVVGVAPWCEGRPDVGPHTDQSGWQDFRQLVLLGDVQVQGNHGQAGDVVTQEHAREDGQESKEEDQLPGGVSDRRQFVGNDVQNVQVAVDLDQDQHGRDRFDRVPVHVGAARPGKEETDDGDHNGDLQNSVAKNFL